MYGISCATAFTGFAVAADASGLFKQLGLAGPILLALHVIVGLLLVVWLVAFVGALTFLTLRRLGRTAPVPTPVAALLRQAAR